jgi:hypothetical protein
MMDQQMINGRRSMLDSRRLAGAAIMIACGTLIGITPAAAIDTALAKQCNGMLAKAFPPAVPGNPAAGSKKGDATQQRAYFKKCVDNNGKMDDAPPAESK